MVNPRPRVTLTWKRCESYKDAKNFHHVVYLFEIKGEPFYWGKAEESFFGGGKRARHSDGTEHCGRYGPGYDHLVEAFIELGGRLYIGKPDKNGRGCIPLVEKYLIRTFWSRMQLKNKMKPPRLVVKSGGEKPRCIQNAEVTRK